MTPPGPASSAGGGGADPPPPLHFRNYAELDLPLGPGLNVFVGENAQGKTNLLEAVATLLLTKSPRTSTPAELLRWGSDETAVDAVLDRGALSETLALRLRRARDADPTGAAGARRHRASRAPPRVTATRSRRET